MWTELQDWSLKIGTGLKCKDKKAIKLGGSGVVRQIKVIGRIISYNFLYKSHALKKGFVNLNSFS